MDNQYHPEEEIKEVKESETQDQLHDSNQHKRQSFRSKQLDPYKNDPSQNEKESIKKVFEEIMFNRSVPMPIDNTDGFTRFQNAVQEQALRENKDIGTILKEIESTLEVYQSIIYKFGLDSLYRTNPYAHGESISDEQPVNHIEYGAKEFPYVGITTNVKQGKVSPNNAFAKFQAMLGLGQGISIDLIHSGFTVIVSPPTQAELLSLQTAIFSSDKELGYATSGFFTSGEKTKVYEILKNFISSKIMSFTLDVLPENLFDYISLLDFDLLLMGILKAGYSKIYVSRICQELINPELDQQRCCHAVQAELDPTKLVHVSRNILTDNMLITLSKRTAGGVSIAERENYLNDLNERINSLRSRQERLVVEIANGVGYEVMFRNPTVNEYLDCTSDWMTRVEDKIDELLSEYKDINQEKAVETIKNITKLSSISSSIKEITVFNKDVDEGRVVFEDKISIMNILENHSNKYDSFLLNLQNSLFEYSNKSPIAYVATPSYLCPKCKAKHQDMNPTYVNEKLIGINVVDFFFSVVGYMKTLTLNNHLLR